MNSTLKLRRNFVVILALVLTLLALAAPAAFAQTDLTGGYGNTLTFFKNYFVTGDYVVNGVGLRGLGDSTGWATGYIPVTNVPAGATVVSAFLYWEAIEATDTASTMNAYFQGYPIVGAQPNPLANTPPCWSSGGGTGSSNGSKHLRVYRADVAPYLVVNGQYQTNTTGSLGYQVKMRDSGSNGAGAPLTEGASLVIVYRTLTDPLRSVVLYDGAWTMNNATSYMSQNIRWFYQATGGPAKLTHIVGDGQANFGEQETFFDGIGGTQTVQNPFNGAAGYSWDNVTFNVTVAPNTSQVATDVLPNSSNIDCLSWGAVVFSTPVVDSDGDGLLDVWEQGGGYWDSANDGQPATWISLPYPASETNPEQHPDLFVQVDYMADPAVSVVNGIPMGTLSAAHSHLPKLQALDAIATAFGNHGINVHFDVGANYQGLGKAYIVPSASARGGNAIAESSSTSTCTSGTAGCDFPYDTYGIPGVVTWKTGVTYNKNQFFQHGRKDSYHYLLAGHALGFPGFTWSVPDLTLTNISVNASNVATVTTSTPHGLSNGALVTISGALGSDNLNAAYSVQNAAGNTFTVTTTGVAAGVYGYFPNQQVGLVNTANGVQSNEPNLTVSSGGPLSISGFSDLGGGDSLITLGLWKADDVSGCQWDPNVQGAANYCNNQVGSVTVQAGTIMHEIGHTLYLTHGGYYSNLGGFGQNCKSNFQSVMNYMFQIRGLPSNNGLISTTTPLVDYSSQILPDLNETTLTELNGMGKDSGGALPKFGARWYGPPSAADQAIEKLFPGTHYAKQHCDGTPLNPGETMVRIDAPTVDPVTALLAPIDWNNDRIYNTASNIDLNFDGFIDPNSGTDPITGQPFTTVPLQGFNDWNNLYLQQVGARRNIGGFSTDITALDLGAGSGGSKLLGGGSKLLGGGSDLINGGSKLLGGGSKLLGGGSKLLGGGSKLLGGGLEVDFDTANKTVDPPNGAGVKQTGKNTITVSWFAPNYGQIRAYYVWRANITKAPMSSTNPPVLLTTTPLNQNTFTYPDNTVKNNQTYLYFVISALGSDSGSNAGNQSGPSNYVTITVQ